MISKTLPKLLKKLKLLVVKPMLINTMSPLRLMPLSRMF
ncbi:Uncharacterised protein [Mycobacteroides abscessus subsp. abscessus]|nr:Uncharacterised protein [Mycobacteroides abscessus subsp. abscessus]